MLSNFTPTMDPQQRRQTHRRQQSTPINFEAQNIHISPATTTTHLGRQTQGLQLIQPVQQIQQFPQEDPTVGITINPGHQSQHCLQVAQQHRQDRPGQAPGFIPHIQLSEQELRRLQHAQLDAQLDSFFKTKQFSPAPQPNDPHYVKIERSQSNPESYNGMSLPNDGTNAFSNADQGLDLGAERPSSSKSDVVGSKEKERSLVQNWNQKMQRPHTPPNQSSSGYFPMTPQTTPYTLLNSNGQVVRHVEPASPPDMDPNATIKPRSNISRPESQNLVQLTSARATPDNMSQDQTIRLSRTPNLHPSISESDLFHGDAMDISTDSLPSPPKTVPLKSMRKFDVALLPGSSSLDDMPPLALVPTGDGSFQLVQTPGSTHTSPQISSLPYESSPYHSASSSVDFGGGAWDSPGGEGLSPSNSIPDLNLYATVEDTGISSEEVQSFISDQNPNNGKWTCLYPECGKNFGRKENIRAHVQTHLGDRQFKCAHCNKRFVRQHDLKRHAKIHSGVKPYPCRCGNSFARQDALTRHRQRGICNGGFEGVVKKVVKRGRPRKDRPTDDDRMDKASRTRKRVAERNDASSVSGTSESSFVESPQSTMMNDFNDEANGFEALANFNADQFTFPAAALTHTPPMSPYSTGNVNSPKKDAAANTSSAPTPASLSLDDEQTIVHNENSMPSETVGLASHTCSQAGSPPGLSHSSPPGSTQFIDLDMAFDNSGLDSSESQHRPSQSISDLDKLAISFTEERPDFFDTAWKESSFMEYGKGSDTLPAFTTDPFNDEILFSDDYDITFN